MNKPKIDHINMVVPNLANSIYWYVNNLGFEIKGHFGKGGSPTLTLRGSVVQIISLCKEQVARKSNLFIYDK